MEQKYYLILGIVAMLLVISLFSVPFAYAEEEPLKIEPHTFNDTVPNEILEKINSYVINRSDISSKYFYIHYEIRYARRIPYSCTTQPGGELPTPKKAALFECFAFNPAINYSKVYAVKISWNFTVNNYSAIAGWWAGTNEPTKFVFIIKDGEVIGNWRTDFLEEKPFPKFREIYDTISLSELNNIIEECADAGIYTFHPTRLLPNPEKPDELSLLYYGWGKKTVEVAGKTWELFINLEDGNYTCKEIEVIGKQERVTLFQEKITSWVILTIGIVIIILALILILYSKLKR
jgi:hypothetical protein